MNRWMNPAANPATMPNFPAMGARVVQNKARENRAWCGELFPEHQVASSAPAQLARELRKGLAMAAESLSRSGFHLAQDR